MNLKRLRGIYAVALITIAAALFAGCSNSMAGSVDGNARGVATLSLSATGIPNDYAEQFAKSYPTAAKAASRSITPNDPYDISDTGLTFKLSGKSETGKVLPDTEVELVTPAVDGAYNFQNSTGGDVTLDAMSWNLKLVAYNSDGKAVLQGFCSVDLRTGSGTAKFTMGTEGLNTEGNVKIAGTFVDEDDAAKSFSMGIYRKDTGEAVFEDKSGTCSQVQADENFDFDQTGVAPGTYLYTMIFYADANCTGNIVGSFTDTLVVDPGNALERELKIDVIGKKPTKPTSLMAYLVNGSEGKDGSPTYNVKVEWTKSTYATNYELQVLEYKGDDTDATSFVPVYDTNTDELDSTTAGNWTVTTYGMSSMDPETVEANKTIKNFTSSAVYGTNVGSSYMMFGDTSCSLLLETGKIYEIRLRGRNYIGVSEYAERLQSGDADGLTGFDADADKKNHINRLLVTYHLNGGTLEYKKTGDSNIVKKENTYAEYKSWTPSLADTKLVENGNDASGNTYTIKNGMSDFDSWLFEKGEGVQIIAGVPATINSATTNASKESVTNFTYKDLTVLASYGNKVTGEISMGQALTDIVLADIVISTSIGSASLTPLQAGGDDYVVRMYTVDKSDATGVSNVLTIVLDGDNASSNYTDVSFTLIDAQNKQKTLPIRTGTFRTCDIDLADYPTGKIQVMVSAVTNKTTTVSRTLIFDLQ